MIALRKEEFLLRFRTRYCVRTYCTYIQYKNIDISEKHFFVIYKYCDIAKFKEFLQISTFLNELKCFKKLKI